MKTIITYFTIALCMLLCTEQMYGQYLQNFQASYPYNKGLNSTKNYTFTKDLNEKAYLLANSGNLSSVLSSTLAMLRLDVDFNITNARSYVSVSPTTVNQITTNDVIAVTNGGYVVCGHLQSSQINTTIAFMAEFDAKLNPVWYMEYPSVATLNAVIEDVDFSTDRIGKYVACGKAYETNKSNGIVVEVDNTGAPLWVYNTASGGEKDMLEYNDIILLNNGIGVDVRFAVTGNAQYGNREKDVLLTTLTSNGTHFWSIFLGQKNSREFIYDEEAYGITQTPQGLLVITGRTACNNRVSNAIVWDDLLLFSINTNATLQWSRRYDLPKNDKSGEYGQKVLCTKNKLFVTGYYRSSVFNPDVSYDGVLLVTDQKGKPQRCKVIGDVGEDLLFATEQNFAQDGIITAGFSNSFNDNAQKLTTYSPYVVESYKKERITCYCENFKVRYHKNEMDLEKIKGFESKIRYRFGQLKEIKNPVSENILCEKIPWPMIATEKEGVEEGDIIPVETSQSSPYDVLTEKEMGEPKLYPNPTVAEITIENVPSDANYSIVSVSGVIMKNGTLNLNTVDISDLNQGAYVIIIEKDNTLIKLTFNKN